jgi:hypothetical protein
LVATPRLVAEPSRPWAWFMAVAVAGRGEGGEQGGGDERLSDLVGALAGGLSRHLAHEEGERLPLLGRTLTAAEWQGFVADQRRKSGIRRAAQLFPWLLDEAFPEQARAVLSQLPARLRVVCRGIWQPRCTGRAHWEP